MSTTPEPETGRQKAGMWIAVLGGPLLAEIYWQQQEAVAFLRDVPPLAAALVSAAICAVGGWLYGRTPKKRMAGMVSAALMGFGCNLAFQLMHGDASRVSGGERMLAFGLGALPGLILGAVWVVMIDEKAKPPPGAAPDG